MMKLLLGRLLPAGVAAGILTSALSPLRPALDAFGAAAIALTGQEPAPVAGGADFGSDLVPGGRVPGLGSGATAAPPPKPRKKLQELANRLRDPNAPKLKEFQAPGGGRAQREPRQVPPVRPAPRLPRATAAIPEDLLHGVCWEPGAPAASCALTSGGVTAPERPDIRPICSAHAPSSDSPSVINVPGCR